jgi:hypothetical protein
MFQNNPLFSKPPGENEIEISVFGPGYGECIVLHLGHNDWLIVDSCIFPKTKKAAALSYLDEIGVPTENVKLIVATHWHDDHIRGLFDIVKGCMNAEFVFSEAMTNEEFIALLAHFGPDRMTKSTSGVQELFEILYFLKKSNKTPKRAIADRPLWNKTHSGISCCITSLTPSDHAILLSNHQIAKLHPQVQTEKGRVLSITPNHSSVVLWITINDKKILLGSDLEVTAEEKCGWNGIFQSQTRPTGTAFFFKAAHHGSKNGDHPKIWEELVSENAYVAVTPFQQGKTKLPGNSDIERICSRRKKSFIASKLINRRAKTTSQIDKIIDRASGIKSRRPINHGFGLIRIRGLISEHTDNWNLETILDADPLCK